MSRATVSTGGVVFERRSGGGPVSADGVDPLHMVFMGDFSGRGSRRLLDVDGLVERRLIEINRDNFDVVFDALQVQLQLPSCEQPIHFRELDDLHPDTLYRSVPLFAQLRALQQRLAEPAQFERAAEELRQWQSDRVQHSAPTDSGVVIPMDLFARPPSAAQTAAAGEQSVEDFIQQIVAPFVQPKADPRAADMIASVAQASAEALRTLMHHGDFQRLEANWRCLSMLVRRIETGRNLKLFILDVSEEELRADFSASNDITQAGLYQRLIGAYQVPGCTPWSVLVSDVMLRDRVEDVRVAAGLSALAVYADAVALVSGSETIAGCGSLAQAPDAADWQPAAGDFRQLWDVLRAEPQSDSLLVAAPRFLVRLPYGARTAPIDSFAFEELSPVAPHRHYLWGNGAYLVALLIAQSFEQNYWDFGANLVHRATDLPLHIYVDDDGDQQAKACAEVYLTDATASALMAAGLCPLRSVKGEASVLIPRFTSLSGAGQPLLDIISAA